MRSSTRTRIIANYRDELIELMKIYPDEEERNRIINRFGTKHRILRSDIDKIIEISSEVLRGEDNSRHSRSLPDNILDSVFGRTREEWKQARYGLENLE